MDLIIILHRPQSLVYCVITVIFTDRRISIICGPFSYLSSPYHSIPQSNTFKTLLSIHGDVTSFLLGSHPSKETALPVLCVGSCFLGYPMSSSVLVYWSGMGPFPVFRAHRCWIDQESNKSRDNTDRISWRGICLPTQTRTARQWSTL